MISFKDVANFLNDNKIDINRLEITQPFGKGDVYSVTINFHIADLNKEGIGGLLK